MANKKTNIEKPYRPRKQIVDELEAKAIITPMEAKSLNTAIVIADSQEGRGKYLLNLEKFIGVQKNELQKAINEDKLTENQKKMLHTLRVYQSEKPLINNPKSIQQAISNYFQIVLEDGNKPTVNGLSLALGITKKNIFDLIQGRKVYLYGYELKGKEEITEAMNVIATMNELDIAQSGMGQMFLGKNHFGLTDKTEININHEINDITDKDLDEKYANMEIIDIETDDN